MIRTDLNYEDLLAIVDDLDVVKYAKTRNFINGSVTYLSPYISRGIISTQQIYTRLRQRGIAAKDMEMFLKELLWRDYFQRLGQARVAEWNTECPDHFPECLVNASTGIKAVDEGISVLRETGYMHNHLRMYLASITLNVAKHPYNAPAKWLYYHLLDADFASNTASWLWVNGDRGKKKYWVNQENINHYTNSQQLDSFLDKSYEELPEAPTPKHLERLVDVQLETHLPESEVLNFDQTKEVLIYTPYNLDPNWHPNESFNRVLWLSPKFFKHWPMADKTIKFILLNARRVKGLQVFVGELEELRQIIPTAKLRMKEHPLFYFQDIVYEERDWIVPSLQGEFPSFFNYWNKASKVIYGDEK